MNSFSHKPAMACLHICARVDRWTYLSPVFVLLVAAATKDIPAVAGTLAASADASAVIAAAADASAVVAAAADSSAVIAAAANAVPAISGDGDVSAAVSAAVAGQDKKIEPTGMECWWSNLQWSLGGSCECCYLV